MVVLGILGTGGIGIIPPLTDAQNGSPKSVRNYCGDGLQTVLFDRISE